MFKIGSLIKYEEFKGLKQLVTMAKSCTCAEYKFPELIRGVLNENLSHYLDFRLRTRYHDNIEYRDISPTIYRNLKFRISHNLTQE